MSDGGSVSRPGSGAPEFGAELWCAHCGGPCAGPHGPAVLRGPVTVRAASAPEPAPAPAVLRLGRLSLFAMACEQAEMSLAMELDPLTGPLSCDPDIQAARRAQIADGWAVVRSCLRAWLPWRSSGPAPAAALLPLSDPAASSSLSALDPAEQKVWEAAELIRGALMRGGAPLVALRRHLAGLAEFLDAY